MCIVFHTQIYLPLKEKLLAAKNRSDDNAEEEDDEAAVQASIDNSTPPGAAYVELLQMLNQDVLPGSVFHSPFISLQSFLLLAIL